jgi:hypothetical protein
LQENHDLILGGHSGINKTYESIKQHYYWSNMKKEIEQWVRKCTKCQLNNVLRAKKKVPMEITTTASHPFEKCSLDIVGLMIECELGNKYILTFQDEQSKFIAATQLLQQDAETVTKAWNSY